MEVAMGVLMVKCPTSGREFSTGIVIEEATFEVLPETMAKSRCPHCGGEHIWWTRESRVVDEGEPSRGVEAARV
jgi:predicted RNA-binding Zn-ribbon protein involved in translation (DUF1610 family)